MGCCRNSLAAGTFVYPFAHIVLLPSATPEGTAQGERRGAWSSLLDDRPAPTCRLQSGSQAVVPAGAPHTHRGVVRRAAVQGDTTVRVDEVLAGSPWVAERTAKKANGVNWRLGGDSAHCQTHQRRVAKQTVVLQ